MSLIPTRLNYGSATLCGVPGHLLNRLQSVLNAAARLVCHSRKYDHVTHLRRDLHWLRVPGRIHNRLAVLVFRCRHNMAAPPYLACDLRWTDEAEALTFAFRLSRATDHAANATARLATVHSVWRRHGHGTVFHLVSLQQLHWLCSKDNWKLSCLITHFRDYILIIYRLLEAVLLMTR